MVKVLRGVDAVVDCVYTWRYFIWNCIFKKNLDLRFFIFLFLCYLVYFNFLPFSLLIYLEMLFNDFVLIELHLLIFDAMIHDLQLIERILSFFIIGKAIF